MGRGREDAGRSPERKKEVGIKLVVAKGYGGIKTAPTSEHVAGTGFSPPFPKRGGA